jgi:hypothetical protein
MRMDAEKRPRPGCDFGVIQEYERLDQLADVGRARQSRDGPVAATAGREHNSARSGIYRRFESILDFETNGRAGDCCCC